MAAGAARHRAPRKSHGSTGNVLQALGVAGGGLLAVTVMTMLAGGPGDREVAVAISPTASVRATQVKDVAARGTAVVAHPPTVKPTAAESLWSVAGRPRPRPIGPTVPAPPSLTPAAPALTPTAPVVAAAVPTPTPTPSPTRPARVQPPPVVHPPAPVPTRPVPTPTPSPTPTDTPTPTPTPSPTDPPPVDPLPLQPAPLNAPVPSPPVG